VTPRGAVLVDAADQAALPRVFEDDAERVADPLNTQRTLCRLHNLRMSTVELWSIL